MPGAILCYHGCENRPSATGGELHVLEHDLRKTVKLLRTWRRIVPLRVMTERIRAGKSVSGLVAMTFDDAYLSVAQSARSVLVDMKVPATLFVVANSASKPVPFWWDRVDALASGGVSADRWRDFGATVGFNHWNDRRSAGRDSLMGPSLRDWIVCEHRGVLPDQLQRELEILELESGCHTQQRSMSWDELEDFRKEGDIDVGVHTRSHPVLPLLDSASLRDEIQGGWEHLYKHHSDALKILAFPYGYYDDKVVAMARECGMDHCLTTSHGLVQREGDGFLLPRLMLSRAYSPLRVNMLVSGLRELMGRAGGSADYSSRPPCN